MMKSRFKVDLLSLIASMCFLSFQSLFAMAGDSPCDIKLKWFVFGPAPSPAMTTGTPRLEALLAGDALRTIPDVLVIDGQEFRGKPLDTDAGDVIDLGALHGESRRGITFYLLASVVTENAGMLNMGAGADWWMHWWVNGRPVFDTLSTGNSFAEVASNNHAFNVPLEAGENIIAVAVIGGARSCIFVADIFDFSARDPDEIVASTEIPAPEYVAAMAAGRRKLAGSWADKELNDFTGAARDFQQAAVLAGGDVERTDALLAWGRARLDDACTDDYAEVRSALEPLLALKEISYTHRVQIHCLIAETYLMAGEYAPAHAAAEAAIDVAARQRWKVPAKLIAVRAYILQRNYQEARRLLEPMAAMESSRAITEEVDSLLKALPVVEAVDKIADTHPRFFLNRALLEKTRIEGLTPFQQAWLEALKTQVDGYPMPPERDAEWVERMKGDEGVGPVLWAGYASHAALAWLLTEERDYYERAVAFLEHAAAVWQVRYDNKLQAYRFHHYRINGLAAYDWLYNDLPTEQRNALGQSLFASLREFHRFWRDRQRGAGDLYNDGVMGWFIGLVFMGNDIPEIPQSACLDLLASGYYRYRNLFEMLEEDSGPDALVLYGAPGYVFQNLAAEANFLDSYRLALGDNYARGFPKRARNVANYTLWNTIAPNRDVVHRSRSKPFTREQVSFNYGWGDEYHINNRMGRQHYPYLMRVADLYAGMGDMIELDELIAVAQAQVRPDYETFLTPFYCWLTPSSPLLMSSNVLTDEEIQTVMARLPRARHFPDPIAHTFMNSGWGEDDTYAMFVAGRRTQRRKHYDENHFIIYKKGFLAMDTGSRFGAPGHPGNYYHQTIAHNCILINMEGERVPSLWGRTSDVNTRGMNKNHGAQVLAFETGRHYSYIASDATECYNEDKSAEVIRQFLFVYPDYFVVFDRVASRQPDQQKTWLLHTQLEPVTENDTFRADHGDGRIFARTLLPRDLQMEKIGGPGREFWVDGQNWPVREDMQRLMYDKEGNPTPERHLFGQWRVEVSAQTDRERVLFLHLLQVGDRKELVEMTPSQLIEADDRVGVEFRVGSENVRVMFNAAGKVGGHIRITEQDKIVLDRPLATDVMPQEGLALTE